MAHDGSELDWTFGETWTFEPRFFESADGPLHYVDEGAGSHAVVLLHGNPTWSYMYRRLIPALSALGRRVIAIDLLGFGRSAKPTDRERYSIRRHVERTAALLQHCGVSDISLVVHDWGGPVGLGVAARAPERLRDLVVLNTFAPLLPGPIGGGLDMKLLRRFVRLPGVAKRVYQQQNAMVEQFLFDRGIANPSALDRHAREAYRAPHPDAESRVGVAAFPLQIPRRAAEEVAADSSRAFERLAGKLRDAPVLLVWGERDPLFGTSVLDQWVRAAPQAEVKRIPTAGHYVLEDAPDVVTTSIASFFGDRAGDAR